MYHYFYIVDKGVLEGVKKFFGHGDVRATYSIMIPNFYMI